MSKSEFTCDCNILHEETVNAVKRDMINDEFVMDIADFFSIFGDSTRIKILWALDKSEMCVCDIAALINMTKSAVSHQLRVLKTNNLVKSRKQGKEVFYTLSDNHIKEIFEKAIEHLTE
ncbi:MAG: ArsR/SmtB family transcription factor [Acutalibacteraceae bacterium]